MAEYDSVESGTALTGTETSSENFFVRTVKDLGVNIDIFNLSTTQSFNDRVSLIFDYCHPWSDFVDVGNFNIPPINREEYVQRLRTNIRIYFYNYFTIGLIFMLLYGLFNLWTVLVLVLYGGMGYALFIAYPEDIEVSPSITINSLAKKIIMGVGAALGVLFGGLGCLAFSIAFFMLVVVGVHASVREVETES